ncbi:hypothetical protein FB451DRAFT_1558176, partial [Mycena latifolia]
MSDSENPDAPTPLHAPPAYNGPTPPPAEHSLPASGTTNPPDDDTIISPKKIAKLASNEDAPSHLPSLRTNRGLESPPHKNTAAPTRPPGLDNIPGPRPISGRERARSALTSRAVSPTPGPNSRTQSVQFRTPPPQLDSEDEDDGLRDEDEVMGDIESIPPPEDDDDGPRAEDASGDELDERRDPTPPPVIIRDNFTYPTEEAFLRHPPRLKNL